jgi:hypothetical protein
MTRNTCPTITPAHILNACETIKRNPAKYLPTSPLPTTPGLRDQAILAAGRDAIATALFEQVPNLGWNNLTKAIRRGHSGDETNFAAINWMGVVALGLTQ